MSKKNKESKKAKIENDDNEELTESAFKGTHKSDFSLEKEQKAKEEECESIERNCDESRH